MTKDEIAGLIQGGRYREALRGAEELPEGSEKSNIIGLTHYCCGDYGPAREVFEAALVGDPLHSDLLYNYAHVLQAQGDTAAAGTYLMRMPDKDWAVYDLLGDIEYKTGSPALAVIFYYQAYYLSQSAEIKQKIDELVRSLDNRVRITFFSLPGHKAAVQAIADTISSLFEVKMVLANGDSSVSDAIRWADILWIEGANQWVAAVTAARPDLEKKLVVCRCFFPDIFTAHWSGINWNYVDRLLLESGAMKEIPPSKYEELTWRTKAVLPGAGVDRESDTETSSEADEKLRNIMQSSSARYLLTLLKEKSGRENLTPVEAQSLVVPGTLPGFLILGAAKCGTTSLFNYIAEYSSNFAGPLTKETFFFTDHYEMGLQYYRYFFPLLANGDCITGEATPCYLFYHRCPRRVYETLPHDIKFIILLRNPIDRALSHYNFNTYTTKTAAHDSLPFSEAIRNEEQRYDIMENNPYYYYEYRYYSYKGRGKYHEQIQRWFRYFPRENFLIMGYEEFFKQPEFYVEKVFDFLGLQFEENCRPQFGSYNKSNYNISLSDENHSYLSSYFRPHNERLYYLLNHDFGWD